MIYSFSRTSRCHNYVICLTDGIEPIRYMTLKC